MSCFDTPQLSYYHFDLSMLGCCLDSPHLVPFLQPSSPTEPPSNIDPKWFKPLSKKVKHSSVIPGSFFEREQKFKVHTQKSKIEVVPPRSEGFCETRTGRFSSWIRSWCRFDGAILSIYAAAPLQSNGIPTPINASLDNIGPPLRKIALVGSHLAAGKSENEFYITYGGDETTVEFKTPSQQQRDEWLVALGQVPGMYRRVEDYYILGRNWGKGATSEVQECIHKFTGKKLALKTRLHMTREATQAMHNELRILQLCAKHPHPAIPTLLDYFFDSSGKIELIMELMEGGELFDWIALKDHLDEDEAKAVFAQVAAGVAHLHSLGIAHRDLKPQNLMYVTPSEGAADGTIKIMDYDLSRVNYSPEWEGSTPCGTIHYMAPEMIRQEKYSLAADCWSLGVILYILLCGKIPFDGQDDRAVQEAIHKGKYCLEGPLWVHVSNEAKDLVNGLLQMDPQQRTTAQQCLEHPWLQSLSSTSSSTLSSAMKRRSPSKGEGEHSLLPIASSDNNNGMPHTMAIASQNSHDLKTIENLRQLGSSLTRSASSTSSRQGNVLYKLAEKVSFVAPFVGSSPPKHVHKSPLSKALDYDLEPLRRQVDEDEKHLYTSRESSIHRGRELSNLRVQLDLVGTQAGLVVGQDGGGGLSPRGTRRDLLEKEFADLDVDARVEEEED